MRLPSATCASAFAPYTTLLVVTNVNDSSVFRQSNVVKMIAAWFFSLIGNTLHTIECFVVSPRNWMVNDALRHFLMLHHELLPVEVVADSTGGCFGR
jgi:hypothetical protein